MGHKYAHTCSLGCIHTVQQSCVSRYICFQGLPTKRTRPVTQPETPTVAKRRHLDDSKKEEEEQSHVIKANPFPNFDKRFVLKYPQRVIEPQPFSFEERDKAAKVEKALPEEVGSNPKLILIIVSLRNQSSKPSPSQTLILSHSSHNLTPQLLSHNLSTCTLM